MTRSSGGRTPRGHLASAQDPARFLRAVMGRFGTPVEVDRDPLRFPRAFAGAMDREAAGLVSSAFAFGRVAAFLPVLEEVFRRLGPDPGARMAALDEDEARALADGIGYRRCSTPMLIIAPAYRMVHRTILPMFGPAGLHIGSGAPLTDPGVVRKILDHLPKDGMSHWLIPPDARIASLHSHRPWGPPTRGPAPAWARPVS